MLKTDRLRTQVLLYDQETYNIQVRPSEMTTIGEDYVALSSFKALGYCIGSSTLLKNVRQVQSASKIKQPLMREARYWEFLPQNKLSEISLAHSEVLKQLEASLINNQDKLKDRQIVVPLSGGYDSRAILLALVKLGFSNILTFTFGRPSSPEVKLSQYIARTLNVEWHCVTYSKATWRRLRADKQFNQYLNFCCSGISVPNVQVYPALESLVKNELIDSNAIVLPGHTGDFVSGGHIPEELMYEYESVEQLKHLAQIIVKRHFKFDRRLRNSGQVPNYLLQQLQERFSQYTGQGYPLASLFEAWECSERQAKFIINSNRYYEFFGLEWFMPLWEDHFVDFWVDVPYQQRKGKKLWVEAVEALWQQTTGQTLPLGHAETHLSPWRLKWKHRLDYFFDNNHLLQLMPLSRWLFSKLRLTEKNGSLYGYLADVMLERYRQKRPNDPIWPR